MVDIVCTTGLVLAGREQAAPGVLLYLILVLDLRGAIRIDPEVEQQVGVRDLRLAQPDVLDHVEAVGDEAAVRPDDAVQHIGPSAPEEAEGAAPGRGAGAARG